MKTFSQLLERLVFTPSRNAKLALLSDYFARTPDPDRGYALAALTGGLSFKNAKAGVIRELVSARVDPVLFGWSYDYVGDLAETAALIWPEARRANRLPGLSEIVEQLQDAKRAEVPKLLEGWLDSLGAEERFALLKLITGGLRVGVSARLTKTALAELGGRDVAEVEEVWHGLSPPYGALFAWLEGRGPRPQIDPRAAFRPMIEVLGDASSDYSAYSVLQIEGDADTDLLKGICQHIVFHDPHGIGEDDVPADKIQTIRAEAIAEAKDSGKNDEIAGKIAEGKVRKFLQENTLLNQKYVLDESKTVKEVLPSGVTVKSFVRYTLGG